MSDTVIKIIAVVLILLIVVALVGVFAKFTDGFTSDFSSFYVTVGDKDVMSVGGGFVATVNEPLKVDVKYVFNSSDGDNENDYSVKIIPNTAPNEDFDFTLNGDVYSYQAEADLTKGFNIELSEKSFTVAPKGNSLTEIFEAIYPDYIVGDMSKVGYSDMFTVLVTSYNGEASVRVNFSITGVVTGISLDKEVIIF